MRNLFQSSWRRKMLSLHVMSLLLYTTGVNLNLHFFLYPLVPYRKLAWQREISKFEVSVMRLKKV
jgi:hypothetical protein